MRQASILIFLCSISACNLFEPVDSSDDNGDTTPDLGLDIGASDAGMDDLDTTIDDLGDGGGFDATESDADACAPESDQELCAAHGAGCGELYVPAPTATTTRYEAEDSYMGCGIIDDSVVNLCRPDDYTEATHTFEEGLYRLRIQGSSETASMVEPHLHITVDGEQVGEMSIRAVNEELVIQERDLQFTEGEHLVRLTFINDAYASGVGDRDAHVDWLEFEGPLVRPRDRCGDERQVTCGTCADLETCGLLLANTCSCDCPLDGECAAQGTHPDVECQQCTEAGWQGVSGACSDDGDMCTTDTCVEDLGACAHFTVTCDPGECEVGVCDPGSGQCDFSTAPDGTDCGVDGVCTDGVCGCADGTVTETRCGDDTDDDCDGDIDCADADCDGSNCGMGNTCSGGICQ